MSFYENMANTAYRLIADKGTDCTITNSSSGGGFDPDTGMPIDDVVATTQTGKCVVLNYSKDLVNMADTLIEQGDKRILLSAKGISLDNLNGTLTALGHTFTIVNVKEINPAGTAVIYEVQGRE